MEDEKKYVLITGATGGIGFALAERFAANGYPLIFVARNQDKLIECAKTIENHYHVQVKTIAQDLCVDDAVSNIFKQVKESGIQVSILLNNAGFNEVGHFIDTDLYKEIDIIRINTLVVIELTKLFLPDMIKNGFGRIVNVCSTGAFFPVPNNAVYCAVKTSLYNFSNAIREELKKTGVKVTALCPGATLTNFPIEAEINNTHLFNIFPMQPGKLAKIAYPGIIKGKRRIIPGLYNKIMIFSGYLTPRFLMNPISNWMYKPVKIK